MVVRQQEILDWLGEDLSRRIVIVWYKGTECYNAPEPIGTGVLSGSEIEELEFRKVIQKIKIEEGKKRKLTSLLQKWIDVGADQVVAEADVMADTSFSVAGFRPGMKCDEAKLLFECRYPEEEIAWSVDEKGLVDRINFGSTFLAKVYKFNVQTWAEWVAAFSRQTGVRFSCDVLRDEKKPIGGRGTIVKVSQKIWRCQDGHKDQRTTDSVKDTWEAMKDAAPAVENFMNNLLK